MEEIISRAAIEMAEREKRSKNFMVNNLKESTSTDQDQRVADDKRRIEDLTKDISPKVEITRVFRIGEPRPPDQKPRPIIVTTKAEAQAKAVINASWASQLPKIENQQIFCSKDKSLIQRSLAQKEGETATDNRGNAQPGRGRRITRGGKFQGSDNQRGRGRGRGGMHPASSKSTSRKRPRNQNEEDPGQSNQADDNPREPEEKRTRQGRGNYTLENIAMNTRDDTSLEGVPRPQNTSTPARGGLEAVQNTPERSTLGQASAIIAPNASINENTLPSVHELSNFIETGGVVLQLPAPEDAVVPEQGN